MRNILIGTAVITAPLGEIESNTKKMISLIREAKKNHAELICFPEMSITGYCSGDAVKEHAINLNHDIFKRLQSVSEELNIVILAGFAQKEIDGQIFASHIVIQPDEESKIYQKTHIAPPEKQTFTAGKSVPVFHIDEFCFGIQLCYDAHFPELSTIMTEKGVDAIFFPHASPRLTPVEKYDSWMRHLPARAFDNSIYVVACNQNGNNGNKLNFAGISLVIDPSGRVLNKNLSGKDSVSYVALTKDTIDSIRGHKMKYFFPNRRKSGYTQR